MIFSALSHLARFARFTWSGLLPGTGQGAGIKIILALVVAVGVWQGFALKKRYESLKEAKSRHAVQTAQATTHFLATLRQKEGGLVAAWAGEVNAYLAEAAMLDSTGPFASPLGASGRPGPASGKRPSPLGAPERSGPASGKRPSPLGAPERSSPAPGKRPSPLGAPERSGPASGKRPSPLGAPALVPAEYSSLFFLPGGGCERTEKKSLVSAIPVTSSQDSHAVFGNCAAFARTYPGVFTRDTRLDSDVPVPAAFASALRLRHQRAVAASGDNTPARDAASGAYARKNHPAAASDPDPLQSRTLD